MKARIPATIAAMLLAVAPSRAHAVVAEVSRGMRSPCSGD